MNKLTLMILFVIFFGAIMLGCGPSPILTSTTLPTPTSSAVPLPSPVATASPVPPTPTRPRISTIQLRSSAFSSGKQIPEKYTCDGEDISPPLSWGDPPPGVLSFVIILDNPDATTGSGWVHWILYNIPAEFRGLSEAVPALPELDDGSLHGQNSEEWLRYVGPCPPFTQRYYFRLYALDIILDLEAGASKEELVQAMEDHILAKGELMGRYKRLMN